MSILKNGHVAVFIRPNCDYRGRHVYRYCSHWNVNIYRAIRGRPAPEGIMHVDRDIFHTFREAKAWAIARLKELSP